MTRRWSLGITTAAALAALMAGSAWAPVRAQQARDAAPAAPVATGTAAIAGTVVTDDAQAAPVRRTTVTVTSDALRGSRETVTDDQGRFLIPGLPAGNYSITAARAGWVTTYYGSRVPGSPPYTGTSLALAAGEQHAALTLRLLHGSAITGKILDASGRPPDATIWLIRPQPAGTEQAPLFAFGNQPQRSVTDLDDRGVYRFYGVAPGDYYVYAVANFSSNQDLHQITPDVMRAARAAGSAPGSSGSTPSDQGASVTYAPVYYPGTVDVRTATLIKLGRDEEQSGIDFEVKLVAAATIAGTIVATGGQPPARAQVQLQPREVNQTSRLGGLRSALVAPNGTFKLAGITPGDYTLFARAVDSSSMSPAAAGAAGPAGRAAGAGPLTLWATQDVSVNGSDLTGLSLTLQPGSSLSGKVTVDAGAAAPPDLSGMTLTLIRVDGFFNQLTTVDATGAFKFNGLMPGSYRIGLAPGGGGGGRGGGAGVAGPSGKWTIASALVHGRDAADLPFAIQLGDDISDAAIKLSSSLGEISGHLVAGGGPSPGDFVVLLLSADRAYWPAVSRRMPAPVAVRPDGSFRVANLPAGAYLLCVLPDVDPATLHDPSALESLTPRGIPVTLADGEKKVQDVKIGGGVSPR